MLRPRYILQGEHAKIRRMLLTIWAFQDRVDIIDTSGQTLMCVEGQGRVTNDVKALGQGDYQN